jgi:hypothetical protein
MTGNDKLYFELKRRAEKGVTKKVKCYGSGVQGTRIRHAVSGKYFQERVGSLGEDKYFSVIVATGESKTGSPILLFYETPDEYERHFFLRLDDDSKKQWVKKQLQEQ